MRLAGAFLFGCALAWLIGCPADAPRIDEPVAAATPDVPPGVGE
jgi:hypothetical protein